VSETAELDKTRRYLRPVARIQLPDEPDVVHLSLYEWVDRIGMWLTGMALCGRSTAQGALPEGTEATCPDCAMHQPTYEAALAREASSCGPAPALLHEQVREAVRASGLKQTWIAGRLGITEKHLSQLLTGRVGMTLYWARQVLDLCGMELVVTVRPLPGVRR
jgi:hypothetical protein